MNSSSSVKTAGSGDIENPELVQNVSQELNTSFAQGPPPGHLDRSKSAPTSTGMAKESLFDALTLARRPNSTGRIGKNSTGGGTVISKAELMEYGAQMADQRLPTSLNIMADAADATDATDAEPEAEADADATAEADAEVREEDDDRIIEVGEEEAEHRVTEEEVKEHAPDLSLSLSVSPHAGGASECFDDDGRLKRTGTVWTASTLIITNVIGSGVLSLPSAIAQLGWVAGPTAVLLFALVTYCTSSVLATCYRSGDPVTGKRNSSYMEAIQANFGGFKVNLCRLIMYFSLFGVAIGYTIAASDSMMAIPRAICFHETHREDHCNVPSNPYMIIFGVSEILFSQIPDFEKISWISKVVAIMSFTYCSIGLGLGIAKVAENGEIKGSLTGVLRVGKISPPLEMFRIFQALGILAFAYSYSLILFEIQDTVKSPPAEHKTMKRATLISVPVTTAFYLICGCSGYAAFGYLAPDDNLLSGFGYYNPYWLVIIANVAIAIQLAGAYQGYCQPIFAIVEKNMARHFPGSNFINKEYEIPLPGGFNPYRLNLFRLVWRSIFVVITTIIAMQIRFFNAVVAIVGALGFWPLAVYFPLTMYIRQKKIPRWGRRWFLLQMLNVAFLFISICAALGSFRLFVSDYNAWSFGFVE